MKSNLKDFALTSTLDLKKFDQGHIYHMPTRPIMGKIWDNKDNEKKKY